MDTDKTHGVLGSAKDLALRSRHHEITPLHLAAALISKNMTPPPPPLLEQAIADSSSASALADVVKKSLDKFQTHIHIADEVGPSASLVEVIRRAQSLKKSLGDLHLGVDHLILALIEDSEICHVLKNAVINTSQIKSEVKKIRGDNVIKKVHSSQQVKEVNSVSQDTNFQTLKGKASDNLMLSEEHIAKVVSRRTGIPVTQLGQNEKKWLLGLAHRLRQRVVGQEHAVDAVATAFLVSRAGLNMPEHPIGSFLFVGPAAAEKAELAKALAEELSHYDYVLIKLHMSEYTEPDSYERLIGVYPWCVGNIIGDHLTEKIRKHPNSVILVEEIEKAHVHVLYILVCAIDNGRLTDNHGRTIDFTKTIIIVTSNLGADHYLTGISDHELVMKEVRKHIRKEMLYKIDKIVIFNPLSHDQLQKVARDLMKDVVVRLAEKNDIALHVTDAALDVILSKSYDPVYRLKEYGATPIRRWIDEHVVRQLSGMLILEEIDVKSKVYIEVALRKNELVYIVENPKTTSSDSQEVENH